MNPQATLLILGLAIMTVATVGLFSSISSTGINILAGEDNVTISSSDAVVTKITWTEVSNEITSATVKVNNTDTVAHTYEICVIARAGASLSDTAGTTADCVSTGSVSADAVGTATVTFSIALSAASVDGTNLSIEQTG